MGPHDIEGVIIKSPSSPGHDSSDTLVPETEGKHSSHPGFKKCHVTDVEDAKTCFLECLNELAHLQEFLKGKHYGAELDLANQVVLTKLSPDESCCKERGTQHLHAKLNGIPVVLKLNQVKLC